MLQGLNDTRSELLNRVESLKQVTKSLSHGCNLLQINSSLISTNSDSGSNG